MIDIDAIALECAKDIPVMICGKDSGFTYSIADAAAIAICTKFLAAVDAARSEQKPTAWIRPSDKGYDSAFRDNSTIEQCTGWDWAVWVPLYLHPAPADKRIGELQAQIDRLMLEYCPDEMTPEQIEEWGKHQVSTGEDNKLLAAYKESLPSFYELATNQITSGGDVLPWTEDDKKRCLEAMKIVKQDRTPEGYALVPIEPTREMCEVIRNEHDIYGSAQELYAMVLESAKVTP